MEELQTKKCVPCEGKAKPLSSERSTELLTQIPGWIMTAEGKKIQRRFEFKNFYKTMSFVNAIAWIANQENHHPDLELGYNYCVVNYSTHAIDGLSENDFICAAKVNGLGGV